VATNLPGNGIKMVSVLMQNIQLLMVIVIAVKIVLASVSGGPLLD